jgi:glucokinase
MILAADIGGTKSLFACFEQQGDRLTAVKKLKLKSKDYSSLEEATKEFLRLAQDVLHNRKIQAAAFGLAGPVINNKCRLTNLGWTVDAKHLQKALALSRRVVLLNDLQGVGMGIPLLGQNSFLDLNPNRRWSAATKKRKNDENTLAILAPGTGLGEAMIIGKKVHPSEGAHSDFAPKSEEEVRLWRFAAKKTGHVSYERFLSGPGLMLLAEFYAAEQGIKNLEFPSTPQDITHRALESSCAICQSALHMFVKILGAEAGNLALKTFAAGGVFIGGGIAPNILPKLKDGTFFEAFCDKGRFSDWLKQIPAAVILDEETALKGIAAAAAKAAGWKFAAVES